ncbi:MAG: DUF3810 family protein [Vicinamibacterales bacterium]
MFPSAGRGPLRLRAAVVAAAIAAAMLPRPPAFIERAYAGGLYPRLQAALTSASNVVPIALFDVAIVAAAVLVAWWGRQAWRARRHSGVGRAAAGLAMRMAVLVSAGYLWFLFAWGLNYARPPIEVRLGLAPGLPTSDDVRRLLDEAVTAVNDGFRPAGASRDGGYRAEDDVARRLAALDRRYGRPRPTAPGRPKPTLLATYFRLAGVEGLTAPVALETLLNPDLLAPERPFTLAHEWAHLSGHAPEADANFVAWQLTTAPDADPATRYSGWLFLLGEAAAQVAPETRRAAMAALAAGPRQDLADIARRQQQRVAAVQRAGWRVYDAYLKSQGVGEGVRSYSRVVELIVRARKAGGGGVPQ